MTIPALKFRFKPKRGLGRTIFTKSLLAMLVCTSSLYGFPSVAQSLPAPIYAKSDGSITSNLGEARKSWREDAEFNGNWGLAAINADAAYARGYTGLDSVIGVIDQPVWVEHPKFVDNVNGQRKVSFITTRGTYLYEDPYMTDRKPGVEFVYDGRIYVDGRGDVATHGTHVGGIAAGNRTTTAARPGEMQGVAFNARIIAADNGDPGPEDGIVRGNDGNAYRAAFEAMIGNNVDIITNSWGIGVRVMFGDTTRQPLNI